MTQSLLTVAILVPEMVVLGWVFARAIGWKPRWRWELESRVAQLEFQLKLIAGRAHASFRPR
jgi:hypothetical protein